MVVESVEAEVIGGSGAPGAGGGGPGGGLLSSCHLNFWAGKN